MASSRKTSLVVRATFWILALVALVGLVSLHFGDALAVEREKERTEAQLHELLSTVESSTSIACFLGDKQLAQEVARGLLANRIVNRVIIQSGQSPLATAERAPTATASGSGDEEVAQAIRRQIKSPFDAKEIVGEIQLFPDRVEIERRVREASYFIAVLMLVELLAVGVAVVAVVYAFMTRPLTRLAGQLERLQAEQGEKLVHAKGHVRDEIGGLVNYVNHLIERLVGLLVEERRLREQREIEERKFRSIFEHAATGIFLLDQQGNLMSCNPACQEIFMAANAEPAAKPSGILPFFGDEPEQTLELIETCKQENRPVQRDVQLRGGKGRGDRWLHLTLSKIEDVVYQGVVNDITERKVAEAVALEAAMTDALTGLLNRHGFETKLGRFLERVVGEEKPCDALMLIDLDLFKQVNDTYGHDAGDRVLIGVAKILTSLVRKSDLVGRLGGDEFVILLTSVQSQDVLERIAREIVDGVSRPFDIGGGRAARIGASVGIAQNIGGRLDQETLFKQADEAMYEAKRRGRNTYCFFDGE